MSDGFRTAPQSVWTLTHHRDFAKGFVGLPGNPHALGEAIHITSDEVLTWNQIVEIIADAAGVAARIVHIQGSVLHRCASTPLVSSPEQQSKDNGDPITFSSVHPGLLKVHAA